MRAQEFIIERKRKKRKPRWAAYGPGPFGGYGFASGYSGASGGSGDGGGVGESRNSNFDAMDYIDQLQQKFNDMNTFYIIVDVATGKKLRMFDPFDNLDDAKEARLLNRLENKTKIVKRFYKNRTGYNQSDVGEGWKDTLAGAALATGMAFGAPGDAEAAKKNIDKPVAQKVVKADPLKQVSKSELSKSVTGNPHEVVLKKAAEKAGIKGNELAAFLSQCAHETMDFKHMKEIGGSLDFKKYDIRFAPNKAKALGNTKPGDGAKFKGRGYIQLTGKYNYKKAGQALGLPLAEKPELVEKPEIAAKVAVWYWQNRVKPNVDNFKDTKDVTKGINPGLKHLDQRKEKHQAFQVAMR